MQGTKPAPTKRRRHSLKRKGKSYGVRDCGLYNLSTKKRLEERLGQSVKELIQLSDDANYRVLFAEKPDGSKRRIEAPSYELDRVHSRIASLLVRVATPDYLHSGVKGRSNVTNAKVHVGDHPLLTIDVKRFYPSVSRKSLFQFFHSTMRACPDVAGILAELCTYNGHLPTGSRISMPLSYWANHKMFNRLYALCQSKSAIMSVYVDDLTFSGKCINKLFQKQVCEIVEGAGFTVHPKKVCLYHSYQPKSVTGTVVTKDKLLVRNKHHKLIYNLFHDMPTVKDSHELEKLQKELLGRLNAAGQIDKGFLQRAQHFQRVTIRSGLKPVGRGKR